MSRLLLCSLAFLATASLLLARDIKTLGDQTYRGVVVNRIEKTGIGITHQDGAAFLDFSILPPDIRKEFGYTETGYTAALAAQSAQREQQAMAANQQARIEAEAAALRAEAQRIRAELSSVDLALARQRLENAATEARAASESQASIATRDYSATDYTKRDYSAERYSGSSNTGGPIQVRGYYRKDGTYVRPHTRRR
jgi:hypothetical protein